MPKAKAAQQPAVEPRKRRGGGLGITVPPDLLMDVRELTLRLTRERGERVTQTALVVEALRDLLAKYTPARGRRKKARFLY